MESRYPAGDEFVLVYQATGRLVPETGLPLHVGCVVQNVQTLFNIARASEGTPVTHRLAQRRRRRGAAGHPVGAGRHAHPRRARLGRRHPAPALDGPHGGGLCGGRRRADDGPGGAGPGRAGDQDHQRAAGPAARQRRGALPDSRSRPRGCGAASRPATSAATAPTSARATCWGTICSRTR